jgi:selT/selW/selH-like putative selenoprotein
LAEALKRELGIEAELIKSSGGVFEVEADGKLIFSKKKEYRFPTNDEIVESLKSGK